MSTQPKNSADLVWEIASLYPPQGTWSEQGYLSLTDSTNRLIEFTDGRIEFLEMPTKAHQLLLVFLLDSLREFLKASGHGGVALPAPLRVRTGDGKYREPDIVFMSAANAHRAGNEFYDGADLVMEVVSHDLASRKRDLIEKVKDYAEALIPEYWIVDPLESRITVYTDPDNSGYRQEHVFVGSKKACSPTLPGFAVDVLQVFASAS